MHTILQKIEDHAKAAGRQLYVVGGAVRDLLLGEISPDIDLAFDGDALAFGHQLANELPGKFIILDKDEGIGRLVCHGHVIDLAVFKDKSQTIEEDLAKRDFTINAMAIPLSDWLSGKSLAAIIDPCGGQQDISDKVIKLTYEKAFEDDPLRILRAFRVQAATGFVLDQVLKSMIEKQKHLLASPAAERTTTELHFIFGSSRASQIVKTMVESGVLAQVCPEIMSGLGVGQPASHHLDVLDHNLAALQAMDEIILRPGDYFPESAEIMSAYLNNDKHQRWLRWAALFHDLGKPDTKAEKEGRITFYQHDQVGAEIFIKMAKRLRFANVDIDKVSLLISQHMRPFHLCNILRKGPVTAKACLRLAKSIGDDLPGLFLLAMADSLAGQGEAKPQDMEKEIAELFKQVYRHYEDLIAPVLSGPPLLTGHDLKDAGLQPGPVFKIILEKLQHAQVAGEVTDRISAMKWLDEFKK